MKVNPTEVMSDAFDKIAYYNMHKTLNRRLTGMHTLS